MVAIFLRICFLTSLFPSVLCFIWQININTMDKRLTLASHLNYDVPYIYVHIWYNLSIHDAETIGKWDVRLFVTVYTLFLHFKAFFELNLDHSNSIGNLLRYIIHVYTAGITIAIERVARVPEQVLSMPIKSDAGNFAMVISATGTVYNDP